MNKLFIVRHGQTDWNIKRLMQGSKDIELNEVGIKQANDLKEIIDLNEIDIVLCSPMKRTRKTAEIIVSDNFEIIYNDYLKERSFGEYEGHFCDDDLVLKQWDYNLNDSSKNSESIQDCLRRAKNFLLI